MSNSVQGSAIPRGNFAENGRRFATQHTSSTNQHGRQITHVGVHAGVAPGGAPMMEGVSERLNQARSIGAYLTRNCN
eukprot:380102-Rhodomonas_salina.2